MHTLHDSRPMFDCAVAFAGGDGDKCFQSSHVIVRGLVVALLCKAWVVSGLQSVRLLWWVILG